MNSRIVLGTVTHARHETVRHAFAYPVCFLVVDVDELSRWPGRGFLLRHNAPAFLSIRDRDYLRGGGAPIRARLELLLSERGITVRANRILLVTTPRVLGYAFNPVNFYYGLGAGGEPVYHVAEVNNTFGESHIYCLDARQPLTAGKHFHVSPFFNGGGHYEFGFAPIGDHLDIRVRLVRAGKPALDAVLSGRTLLLTPAAIRRTLFKWPWAALSVMPRILTQAAHLYFRKRLPVTTKPLPASADTIGTAPLSWSQRLAWNLVARYLCQLRVGRLTVVLPGGQSETFGGHEAGPAATLEVRDPACLARWLVRADIGFGDSYVDGQWGTPDLTGLLSVFAINLPHFHDRSIVFAKLQRLIMRAGHLLNRNTPCGSRRNIPAHYDLGNAFFESFLDPTLTYSCAIYREPGQDLLAAQLEKIRAIMRKADIAPTDHVLEIGCGWGSFAIEAARSTGCRVTGITLSPAQLEVATRRAAAAGVADRVQFRLLDYRHLQGLYDKIVSIEMFEAVGHENYGIFFRVCDRILKPGGLIVLQTITIPDQRYETYRRGVDWIQRRVFPGGHLPALSVLAQALSRKSSLIIEHCENIGYHYTRTLRDWRERFSQNWHLIQPLGFDARFARTWNYYLAYCESGFATHSLCTLQLVLSRPHNPTLSSINTHRSPLA